jgi:hypothetical protein
MLWQGGEGGDWLGDGFRHVYNAVECAGEEIIIIIIIISSTALSPSQED